MGWWVGHSPVSRQEAQAGGADFVAEDDHGQDVAVRLAVGQLDHPPLQETGAAVPGPDPLLLQLQIHIQVAVFSVWKRRGKKALKKGPSCLQRETPIQALGMLFLTSCSPFL